MADANGVTVRKANCDLCNADFTVAWFCDECTQHLCDNCQFVHSKSTASKLHEVSSITLTQEEPEEHKGSDFEDYLADSEVCTCHAGNLFTKFCDSCDRLVCKACIKEQSHAQHRLVDIGESAESRLKSLNKKIDMLNKYGIVKSRQKIAGLQNNRDAYTRQVNENRIQIRERSDRLKNKIDEITETLLKELETKEEADLQYVDRKQRQLTDTASNIQDTIDTCIQGTALKSNASLIKFCMESELLIDELRLSTFESIDAKIIPPKFNPGGAELDDLAPLFGQLEHVANPLRRSIKRTSLAFPKNIKAQVRSTITQKPRNGAFSVYSTGNGNAMVGTEARTIEVINASGKLLSNIKIDITPYNIACSALGKDLYLSMRNMTVKKLMNGSFSTHIETTPFQPQGLCVNDEGELFVCLYHAESSVGKVVRYSPDGKVVQEIEFDENGRYLFENPVKIAVNGNKDVCVVDAAKKSIVTLSMTGKKRFTYSGPRDGRFEPMCITCSVRGCILIGDHVDDRVHLLDKHGNFLQYILTKDDGLNEIIGISSDVSEKRIWICCFDKIVVATLDR